MSYYDRRLEAAALYEQSCHSHKDPQWRAKLATAPRCVRCHHKMTKEFAKLSTTCGYCLTMMGLHMPTLRKQEAFLARQNYAQKKHQAKKKKEKLKRGKQPDAAIEALQPVAGHVLDDSHRPADRGGDGREGSEDDREPEKRERCSQVPDERNPCQE